MANFLVIKIFLLTTLSFIVTFALTPFLTHFLYKYRLGKGIRDAQSAPIFAQMHAKKAGTPTMGGILIWGTTLLLVLLFAFLAKVFDGIFDQLNFLSRPETLLPLGALVASALIGLVDDAFDVWRMGKNGGGLRMRHRFIIYGIIAAIGAWWFYFKLEWTVLHIPFLGNFDIGWWYIPFFLFVIIATAHSVNITDGLDGLAGGTLLTAFGAYGAIAFAQGRYDLATFCGVIVGSLLAFLWFNINPARFFMGDTGSMSLGVTLGIIAMLTNAALLLPVIGFIFVLESLSVIIQQIAKKFLGRKVFISSPIHHHLEAIGWPEPKIVMRFWVIAGVAAVIGLILFLVDKA
ncbi:MAG: phospho-N-acetylmuramoyl-pentapeptide-transferase [Candidatus Buchananbacteria bacterium RIFCSPLOWO2_01_FULL_46_12]|uniref:Phospho-N-acetylmuramoyl-pentapeptide-transferase n=2 Tax=Candidatus Buchananiibacteriota TaxID=1817903 RepID=A0A1G1YQ54_9BACT|nr:MAG: phospho-N-acetylmuramoyl-pentapeptide-transferase [Candidatus Buchananbacteria bacterium RIFCSPHIGHO2_01_FULL_44_11]OGY54478.1 MAG: phospho-N-acetylmuramoyl-pentapeptide-transferase [Candidatus Buchananbacteria bacterium RIFCSPLOWO2_01_FULL_46_12]